MSNSINVKPISIKTICVVLFFCPILPAIFILSIFFTFNERPFEIKNYTKHSYHFGTLVVNSSVTGIYHDTLYDSELARSKHYFIKYEIKCTSNVDIFEIDYHPKSMYSSEYEKVNIKHKCSVGSHLNLIPSSNAIKVVSENGIETMIKILEHAPIIPSEKRRLKGRLQI